MPDASEDNTDGTSMTIISADIAVMAVSRNKFIVVDDKGIRTVNSSYEAPDVKAGEGPKTEQISSGIILVVGPRAAHTRSLIQLKPTNVGDASSNRPLRRTPRHSSNTYSEPSSGQQQP